MTPQAVNAIKAAKGFRIWGDDAARRFTKNYGISPRLLRIARQCEATINLPFERRINRMGRLNGLI